VETQELDRHVEREIALLQQEFEGSISPEEVARICWAQVDQLRASARIDDFIPLLVHRHAREALIDAELHRAA
jgi:hypothetical protein